MTLEEMTNEALLDAYVVALTNRNDGEIEDVRNEILERMGNNEN